ncbi:MAG: alpha/beta hydrolase [Bryobacterales bacterium]|jgi:pimeloyl-ACP methyl ester carboxylesterase|nr:alpha/beta hydrolase [Bryobacterales bacterium]
MLEAHMHEGLALFAVTLPGFGFTPRDPKIQSLKGFADWLAREVAADTPRPRYLLGHGIGGSIACEFLQHYPHMVDGVILHAPVGAHLERRWFPRLMRLPGMRRMAQWMLGAPLLTPLWRRLLFRRPVPREVLRRFFAEYRACTVFGQLFDWINASWFQSLRPIAVPTILLWGEQERVLRSGQADVFARIVPVHQRILVPDWDHFPMLESPADYSRVVMDALGRLDHMRVASTTSPREPA